MREHCGESLATVCEVREIGILTDSIDIKAKAPFPAGALSNFGPHKFTIDGVACGSMEGFLQSLKIEDNDEQQRVCRLVGAAAQKVGRTYDWSKSGSLWWRGEPIDRLSDAYQTLLDRAYEALFIQSDKFRAALAASGNARLTHALGSSDPCETILTCEEFCPRLERLREIARS
jgi:predicted NAD-dependent protein-ADP-ribosyltransferase YbiA (DUF1768 family)